MYSWNSFQKTSWASNIREDSTTSLLYVCDVDWIYIGLVCFCGWISFSKLIYVDFMEYNKSRLVRFFPHFQRLGTTALACYVCVATSFDKTVHLLHWNQRIAQVSAFIDSIDLLVSIFWTLFLCKKVLVVRDDLKWWRNLFFSVTCFLWLLISSGSK